MAAALPDIDALPGAKPLPLQLKIGFAIVAPFGLPGRLWSLTFVPDDGGPPLDLVARARGRDAQKVRLQVTTALGAAPMLGAREGDLHVAATSRELPGGLWIGRAAFHADGELRVDHTGLEGAPGLAVVRHVGVRERLR